LTTATNFGTKATSTVTVGVSGQTTNIVGTVQINGTAYSAPPNISTTTTYSDQATSTVTLGNVNQQTNIAGATVTIGQVAAQNNTNVYGSDVNIRSYGGSGAANVKGVYISAGIPTSTMFTNVVPAGISILGSGGINIQNDTGYGTVNISTSGNNAVAIGNSTGSLTLNGSSIAFSKSQAVSSTSAHTASYTGFPLVAIIALSSEIGVISQSTSVPLAQWRVPFKCNILGMRASLNYNDATNNIAFNACLQTSTNQAINGTSLFLLLSSALIIPAGQYSSVTASAQGTLNASLGVVPDDTIIAIYCTSYNGATAGGAKVSIYYSYAA
jgi:hypothetical protein